MVYLEGTFDLGTDTPAGTTKTFYLTEHNFNKIKARQYDYFLNGQRITYFKPTTFYITFRWYNISWVPSFIDITGYSPLQQCASGTVNNAYTQSGLIACTFTMANANSCRLVVTVIK